MATVLVIQQLLHQLQCPLCKRLFVNPHTFNSGCGHTFCWGCVVDTLEGPGITASQCPTCARPAWKRDLAPNHKYQALVEQLQGLARALQQEEAEQQQPPAGQQQQQQQGSQQQHTKQLQSVPGEQQGQVEVGAHQEAAAADCLQRRHQELDDQDEHHHEEHHRQQEQQPEQQQQEQDQQEQEPSQLVVVPDSEAVGTAPTVAGSYPASIRPSSAGAGCNACTTPSQQQQQQQQAAASHQGYVGAGSRLGGPDSSMQDVVGGTLGPLSAAEQPAEAVDELQQHLGAAGATTLPQLLQAVGLLQPAASPAAAWWLQPVAAAALMQAAADLPPAHPQEVVQVAAHLATIQAALADMEALLAEAMAAAMGPQAALGSGVGCGTLPGAACAGQGGRSAVSGLHQHRSSSQEGHHLHAGDVQQPADVAGMAASEQVQQQTKEKLQQQLQQQQQQPGMSPVGSHSSGPLAFKCKRRRAPGQGPRRLALQEEEDDAAAQQHHQHQQDGRGSAHGFGGGADSCPQHSAGQLMEVEPPEGLQRLSGSVQPSAAAAAAAAGPAVGEGDSPPAKRTRRRCAPMQMGPFKALPQQLADLRARVEVFWLGDQKYYGGTITRYNRRSGKHTIEYDDGDVEQVVLNNEAWTFTSDQPPEVLLLVQQYAAQGDQQHHNLQQLLQQQQQQQMQQGLTPDEHGGDRATGAGRQRPGKRQEELQPLQQGRQRGRQQQQRWQQQAGRTRGGSRCRPAPTDSASSDGEEESEYSSGAATSGDDDSSMAGGSSDSGRAEPNSNSDRCKAMDSSAASSSIEGEQEPQADQEGTDTCSSSSLPPEAPASSGGKLGMLAAATGAPTESLGVASRSQHAAQQGEGRSGSPPSDSGRRRAGSSSEQAAAPAEAPPPVQAQQQQQQQPKPKEQAGGAGGDQEDDWVPGHKRMVRHGSGSSRRRNRLAGGSVSRRMNAYAAGIAPEEVPASDAAGDRPPLAALPHHNNAPGGGAAAAHTPQVSAAEPGSHPHVSTAAAVAGARCSKHEEAALKHSRQHAAPGQLSRRPAATAAAQPPPVPEAALGGSHSAGSGQGGVLDPITYLFGGAAAPAAALGSKQQQAGGAAVRSKAGRKGAAARAPAGQGPGQAGKSGSMSAYLRAPGGTTGGGGGGRRGRPR